MMKSICSTVKKTYIPQRRMFVYTEETLNASKVVVNSVTSAENCTPLHDCVNKFEPFHKFICVLTYLHL